MYFFLYMGSLKDRKMTKELIQLTKDEKIKWSIDKFNKFSFFIGEEYVGICEEKNIKIFILISYRWILQDYRHVFLKERTVHLSDEIKYFYAFGIQPTFLLRKLEKLIIAQTGRKIKPFNTASV